jgi:cytidylate kinase
VTESVLTVSGPPGSGKSTAGRMVAARRGLEYISAGDRFRAEAARRGLDLAAFSRLAEQDDSIDRSLDDQMVALARPGRLLDGRIQGALLRRRGIPVRDILVTAREEVRVQRLAERDHQALDVARDLTRGREASERRRYLRYYGIEVDREPSDLTVDSSDRTAEEVVGLILEFLGPTSTGHR